MGIKVVVAGSLEDHAVVKYALSSTMPDAAVEVAADGFRALELARRSRPNVVVLDPGMSSLAGADLVARLRHEAPDSPVVCWTGRPDIDEATDVILAGASGYLLKDDG